MVIDSSQELNVAIETTTTDTTEQKQFICDSTIEEVMIMFISMFIEFFFVEVY